MPFIPDAQKPKPSKSGFIPDSPAPFGNIAPLTIPSPADPNDIPATVSSPPTTSWIDESKNALARGGLRMFAGVPGTLATFPDPSQMILSPTAGPMPVVSPRIAKRREKAQESAKAELQKVAKTLYDEAGMESLRPQKSGAGGYILNTTLETLPLMAASTVAGLATGGVGAFAIGAMAEGEAAYQNAIQEGADEPTAQTERLVVGTINGLIERMQADKILKLSKGVGSGGIRAIINAIKQRSMKKLGKEVGRAGLRQLGTAINEGAEEALQELVSMGAATVGHGGKFEISRVPDAFVGGFTAGGVLGVGGSILGGGPSLEEDRSTTTTPDAGTPATTPSEQPLETRPRTKKPKKFELTDEGQKAINRINTKLLNNETLSDEELDLLDIVTEPDPIPQEAAKITAKKLDTAPADPDILARDVEAVRNKYLADRLEMQVDADRETEVYREQLAAAVGYKVGSPQFKAVDEAMQVYVDLQNNPDQLKYYDKLSPDRQAIVDRAMNLPESVKAVADTIVEKNKEVGSLAEQAGILRDTQESYTARIWAAPKRRGIRVGRRKFGTTTERGKQRTLEGILHGWSLGKELQVKGLTSAHNISRRQVFDTMADKELLAEAKGHGLISTVYHEGWVPIKHPNFTTWQASGKVLNAEEIKNFKRGRNSYVTDDGVVMERRSLYAVPKLGKHLNNILGQSALKGIPAIDAVTYANAAIKGTMLFTSFFHHQAYIRSYSLGSAGKRTELSPVAGYRAGKQAYLNFVPELRMGVRNGLTLGKIQDYDAAALDAPNSVWSRMTKAAGPAGALAQKVVDLRKWNERILFGKMGPYLKANAYLLEFKDQTAKHADSILSGEVSLDELAKRAADLVNNDFGGLNLDRMGRNPTVQHIFHLLALAPDWTESNVRSALNAFKLGDDGAVYRAFWARIAARTVLLSVVGNFLLGLIDPDDDFISRYRKAWRNGNLRWLDVDITPIYRALGGDKGRRRYFSILGHFKDPYKFVARDKIEDGILQGFPDPVSSLVKSAKYKGSVATRMLADAVTGTDWAGREFTSLQDLVSGGRLSARTFMKDAPTIKLNQIPSFLLYETKSNLPIQLQEGIGFILGELEGFDAAMTSLGTHLEKGYDEPHTLGNRSKPKVDRSAP